MEQCAPQQCARKSHHSKLAKLDDFTSFTELHDHGAWGPLLQVQCNARTRTLHYAF